MKCVQTYMETQYRRQKESFYNCDDLESQYLVRPLLFLNSAMLELSYADFL